MSMPAAHRAYLDREDSKCVELDCPACGERDSVPTNWYSKFDPYLSACFVCATAFDLEWDECGGDTLMVVALHELRTDEL